MNQAQKDRWVADLLSGRYAQTRGALCIQTSNGACKFCGVGVLLDGMGMRGTPLVPVVGDGIVAMVYDFGDEYTSIMMPPRDFAGIPPHVLDKVSVLNDQEGWDFREIAEYVRDNVPVD